MVSTFLDETEPNVAAPLFEVQLELQEPIIVFRPNLDTNDTDGFYMLVQLLLDDIILMGEMIDRVKSNADGNNYRGCIESNPQVRDINI